MASQPTPPSAKYYCHTCKAEITPLPDLPELTCPTCRSEFVEEVDVDDPPVRPPPPPPAPTQPANPILPQLFMPMNPGNELLPIAQMINQLARMHTNNNNNRITIQAGPMPNFMFNVLQGVFPGPPLAGNPGDYVFGGNFDQIVNQLFQNYQHTGNPPAAKNAVDQLHKGCISQEHTDNKMDCAICKEEFVMGSEFIEMPCKHIFDKECILQWLAIHNSCPVCRFELTTDNADYEANRRSTT